MERVFRHPRWVLAVLTIAVIGFGHRALFVEQDNSPETLFAADPEARATYAELVRAFGGDEVVLVQLRGASVDSPEDLRALDVLERRLSEAPGVDRVYSVAQILRPAGPPSSDEVEAPSPTQVRTVVGEVEAIGLYQELGLVNREAPALGVLAVVTMDGAAGRERLLSALEPLRDEIRANGYQPLVAGLAPANAAIDRELRRSMQIFMPLVALVALVIGWVLFRSVRALFALFLPAVGAVMLGVAGLELAGESLNLVTAVMPPLVLAIGFAGALHLVSHYASCARDESLSATAAVQRTVREKLIPTAFAFGTTAIGFASLALSDMRAVRVFGVAAGLSLTAAMVLVTLGTPSLVLILRPRLHMPAGRQELLARLARFGVRRRPWVLGVGVLAAAFLVAGATRIEQNINGMDFLPESSPERADYQQLEREELGLGNLDVWIKQDVPDERALLERAPNLSAMADELREVPGITGAMGAHELLRIVGYRMTGEPHPPSTLAPLALLGGETYDRLISSLRAYWHPEHGLKLTLLAVTGDEATTAEQLRRIEESAARNFPEARIEVSGQYAMLISTPGAVTRTLLGSLAVTVTIVAVLLLLLFRSVPLVLSGMVANLLPVVAIVGAMGWLGIAMDVATVMIGSVAFGLAVDDSFHMLYHRRESGSVIHAARIAGQGIVATTFVIAGGFAVLGLSGFAPVVRLGLMLSFGAVAALAVDALLLPALLGERRREVN